MHDEVAALLDAHQRESARVSRILHDQLGQLLTAAGLHLDALRWELQDSRPEIAECTRAIQDVLETAIQHVRDLSYDTNPSIVERVGLRAALERMAARSGGTAIAVDVPSGAAVLEPGASKLYVVAWRACAIAQHSGARNIIIKVRDETDAYVLEVLYDVSSPVRLETLTSVGIPVVIESAPDKTLVRAQYFHGLRGSAC